MVALKRLTEEEAALAAILMDDTGVDLMEFAMKDDSKPDGCLRLRPYQWAWYTQEEKYSISACARDVGKSFRIIGKALAHVHASPGTDFFITAPGADHLNPLATKIEELVTSITLLNVMLKASAGKTGIRKVPSFEAIFKNGAKIITRLPKEDGRGVKGQHAKKVIVDEAQDYPEKAWDQLYPTLRADIPGAQMEIYGVTVGSNSVFDMHANDPESIYRKIRKIGPERPTWGPDERKAAIKQYGSETGIRYSQNIFGVSQGVYSDLFVTARLMACVRIDESPWAKEYNRDVYQHVEIDDDRLRGSGKRPIDMMVLPPTHLETAYEGYWAGWDIGFTRDASELLVFGALKRPKHDLYSYRLLTRVSMKGISTPHQVEVATWLMDFYGPRFQRLALDGTGAGLPIFQLFDAMPTYRHLVRGYGFSEKLVVGWEDRKLKHKEKLKDLEIRMRTPDHGLDQLRDLVDSGRWELPMDIDLVSQLQGIGEDHALDACRLFGVGLGQFSIEKQRAALEQWTPMRIRFGE